VVISGKFNVVEAKEAISKRFDRLSPKEKVYKKKNYLQAKLIFEGADIIFRDHLSDTTNNNMVWNPDPKQHAVLSSGGKDSLLSFGLLREMGYRVHPIFLNESGRHWYTALNAYRYFKENVPYTSRVWTNSDRIFNWMLKHLPFVRGDYSKIRSDEYPIRLWTVAVFLFGSLPILMKRGIGRLVIGNEFDTTHRSSHKGITNFDGLYDQSRYFDESLSRFFNKKGWGISQFSILRPLSEILIEKTLVEKLAAEGGRDRSQGRGQKARIAQTRAAAIAPDLVLVERQHLVQGQKDGIHGQHSTVG